MKAIRYLLDLVRTEHAPTEIQHDAALRDLDLLAKRLEPVIAAVDLSDSVHVLPDHVPMTVTLTAGAWRALKKAAEGTR